MNGDDNNQVIPRLRTFFPIHIHNVFQLLLIIFQRLNLPKKSLRKHELQICNCVSSSLPNVCLPTTLNQFFVPSAVAKF
jgi:hypothetical protein